MDDFIGFLLIANVVLAFVVAYAADQKGRSGPGFFFLAFFLSFLPAILILLAMPVREQQVARLGASERFGVRNGVSMVCCPFCSEWVVRSAMVCKFCNRDIGAIVEQMSVEDSQRRELARQSEIQLAAQRSKERAARFAALSNEIAGWVTLKRKAARVLLVSAVTLVIAAALFQASLPTPEEKAQAAAERAAAAAAETMDLVKRLDPVASGVQLADGWLVIIKSCGGGWPAVERSGYKSNREAISGEQRWELRFEVDQTTLTVTQPLDEFIRCFSEGTGLSTDPKEAGPWRKDISPGYSVEYGFNAYTFRFQQT